MASHGPLSGYRILDLTQFESGTVCTETLAWLGAEVIKVERPVKGELGRYSAAAPGVDTYGFLVMNMNKKSVTCNMKSPDGIQLIREILAKSDVIVENMGPGSINRLGLGYEDCKKINPKIIWASIKGFATGSPYQDYPAFDPIATHTGGLVSSTGLPDMPIKPGVSVADSGTGLMCAMSIVSALLQREREGIGQRIECAMQDFIIGLSRSNWEPYYNYGYSPRRAGNGMPLENVAPSNTYPCKPFGTNDYVHVYCSRAPGSKNFESLCRVIGREDLITDERMKTPQSRYKYREELDKIIGGWCAQHTKQEAMDLLAGADVPAAAMLDISDFAHDPQYTDRGIVVEVDHPQHGRIKLPGFAANMSENHIEYTCSPALGGSNEEVYKGILGLSDEEFERLKADKTI